MKEQIIQVIAAFFGSLGFAIVLKIKGRQVFYAGIGGLITWAIYLMVYDQFQSYFVGNLVASIFVAIYAEVMARINKAPATIFLTAAAVPLVPGGKLYYTMEGLIKENNEMVVTNFTTAVVIALAISMGFVIVAVVNKYINRLPRFRRPS